MMEIIMESKEGKILLFIAICAVIFVVGNFLISGKPKGRSEIKDQKPSKNNEPVWTKTTNKKWTASGWYYDEDKHKWIGPDYEPNWQYNETARMWVDADQMDEDKSKRNYEENRRRWQEFEAKEAAKAEEERRIQSIIDEKNKPIYLTEEEKELSRQIHIERTYPTFEEWKAARQKEEQEKG